MLELSNLTVSRGGRVVVSGVSLTVVPGQVTALLGANGAGKSELVQGVAGLLSVSAGRVTCDGRDLTNAASDRIRAAGVAAVPEGHHVLTQLSVEVNLRAAAALLPAADVAAVMEDVWTLFPELSERKRQRAGTLSGGQQQVLALGHALMCRPRYLLIDEMSLGLAPLIVKRLTRVVADLAARGIGVLLVEQFVEVALRLASRVVVLRKGGVRLSVHPDEVRSDRARLTDAYLGPQARRPWRRRRPDGSDRFRRRSVVLIHGPACLVPAMREGGRTQPRPGEAARDPLGICSTPTPEESGPAGPRRVPGPAA